MIGQAFLGIDAILALYRNIAEGIVVWPKVIERRVAQELPFMATENLMMAAVRAGGDRQELHETIRSCSMEASRRIKEEGRENTLLAMLKENSAFAKVDFEEALDARKYTGLAAQQTERFCREYVFPAIEKYSEESADEIRV